MKTKRIDWGTLKNEMSTLSPEDWNEINLKVKIVGEIIAARQSGDLTQRA